MKIKALVLILLVSCSPLASMSVGTTDIFWDPNEVTPWDDMERGIGSMQYVVEFVTTASIASQADEIFNVKVFISPELLDVFDHHQVPGLYWATERHIMVTKRLDNNKVLESALPHELFAHRLPHVVFNTINYSHSQGFAELEQALWAFSLMLQSEGLK